MPVVVLRIEGHPQPASLETDDWVVSRPSNTDDDLNRYLHKPENTTDRWRIEDPKGYGRQGRIVDVNITLPSIFSDISIDEDAVRYVRVFLTSDQQAKWPQVGERVTIAANPVAHGPWICVTPRGPCTSSQPASDKGSQSALIGDAGKVVKVTPMRSARNEPLARVEIDVLRPVKP